MAQFKILNARQSIKAGGQVLEPEPLFLQSGSWVGVLSTDDENAINELGVNPLATAISQDEYDGLKKNGIRYTNSFSPMQEPIIPAVENPAEPVEVEKPDTVDEVLVMEKATSPPDALSEEKPKPRSRKKK